MSTKSFLSVDAKKTNLSGGESSSNQGGSSRPQERNSFTLSNDMLQISHDAQRMHLVGGIRQNSNPSSSNTIPSYLAELKQKSNLRLMKIKDMESYPKITMLPLEEREKMVLQKLKLCCMVFDFDDALSELHGKQLKQGILKELVDYMATPKINPMSESVYSAVMEMFSANILRTLPPHVNPSGPAFDPEEDEPVLQNSWVHLQLVYEIFIRFLDSPDFSAPIARKYISIPFVSKLLQLFDNEDPRERDMLKTTLHRVYGKFLQLRAYIRKAIGNIFLEFCYEKERHMGISELLEILGSIINGFAVPLKTEHKIFLEKILIPLHRTRVFSMYYPQLSYCINQFALKDKDLGSMVVVKLCRIWPMLSSSKQVLFLSELEELVDGMDPGHFTRISDTLLHQLAYCINCAQFQVAERALYFWNNYNFVRLLLPIMRDVYPILFPVLFSFGKRHWNKTLHGLAVNALKIMLDADTKAFEIFLQDYQREYHALKDAVRQSMLLHIQNRNDIIYSGQKNIDQTIDPLNLSARETQAMKYSQSTMNTTSPVLSPFSDSLDQQIVTEDIIDDSILNEREEREAIWDLLRDKANQYASILEKDYSDSSQGKGFSATTASLPPISSIDGNVTIPSFSAENEIYRRNKKGDRKDEDKEQKMSDYRPEPISGINDISLIKPEPNQSRISSTVRRKSIAQRFRRNSLTKMKEDRMSNDSSIVAPKPFGRGVDSTVGDLPGTDSPYQSTPSSSSSSSNGNLAESKLYPHVGATTSSSTDSKKTSNIKMKLNHSYSPEFGGKASVDNIINAAVPSSNWPISMPSTSTAFGKSSPFSTSDSSTFLYNSLQVRRKSSLSMVDPDLFQEMLKSNLFTKNLDQIGSSVSSPDTEFASLRASSTFSSSDSQENLPYLEKTKAIGNTSSKKNTQGGTISKTSKKDCNDQQVQQSNQKQIFPIEKKQQHSLYTMEDSMSNEPLAASGMATSHSIDSPIATKKGTSTSSTMSPSLQPQTDVPMDSSPSSGSSSPSSLSSLKRLSFRAKLLPRTKSSKAGK